MTNLNENRNEINLFDLSNNPVKTTLCTYLNNEEIQ